MNKHRFQPKETTQNLAALVSLSFLLLAYVEEGEHNRSKRTTVGPPSLIKNIECFASLDASDGGFKHTSTCWRKSVGTQVKRCCLKRAPKNICDRGEEHWEKQEAKQGGPHATLTMYAMPCAILWQCIMLKHKLFNSDVVAAIVTDVPALIFPADTNSSAAIRKHDCRRRCRRTCGSRKLS
jgi:hypothetical protein